MLIPALWGVLLLSDVDPAQAGDALDPLYDRIAADLKQGKPLVVTVHVALCDNNIIWCGGEPETLKREEEAGV